MTGASRSGKTKVSQVKSRSARAGVTFPVGRLSRHMRRRMPHARLGAGAPVYMAAVLEYLTGMAAKTLCTIYVHCDLHSGPC